ncbi:transporter [Parapedobacter sp.]
MTYKTISIFFFLFGSIAVCRAQELSINTDRPDQSDGVSTVPVNRFQVEEGLTLARRTAISNLMLRYGVTNSTEIRVLVDAGKEDESSGLQPVTWSVKQKIITQRRVIPSISFVGYLAYGQWASEDFRNNQWPFQLKLAFENGLSDKLSLGYNIGTANKFENLDLSLNFGYAPTDRISTFVEYFSSMDGNNDEHNVDTGILYLITPLLQADIAVGHSIFAADDRFFNTFGLSYLFN